MPATQLDPTALLQTAILAAVALPASTGLLLRLAVPVLVDAYLRLRAAGPAAAEASHTAEERR